MSTALRIYRKLFKSPLLIYWLACCINIHLLLISENAESETDKHSLPSASELDSGIYKNDQLVKLKAYFPNEVYQWLKDSKVAIRTSKFAESKIFNSSSPITKPLKVENLNAFGFKGTSDLGSLMKSVSRSPFELPSNPQDSADALLLNFISNYWSFKLYSIKTRLYNNPYLKTNSAVVSSDKQTIDKIDFELTRINPTLRSDSNSKEQLFRETIKLSFPDSLLGYSYLSIRFWGLREDAVWIHNPVITDPEQESAELIGTRRVSSLNRHDPIIGTAISPDDLWGYSGRFVKGLSFYVEQKKLLVPTSEDLEVKVSAVDGCVQFNSPDIEKTNLEGYFEKIGPFNLKELYRVLIIPSSPFSEVGRYEFWFDLETATPVYQIWYDRLGKLMKWSLNSAKMVAYPDNKNLPIFQSTFVLSESESATTFANYLSSTFCTDSKDKGLEEFDPSSLCKK